MFTEHQTMKPELSVDEKITFSKPALSMKQLQSANTTVKTKTLIQKIFYSINCHDFGLITGKMITHPGY